MHARFKHRPYGTGVDVDREMILWKAYEFRLQNTKFQKERCLRIVEDIHHLLCVLTSLCIHSEDIQSPNMLHRIAQYAV
jgi:hypothetical protein